MFNEFLDLRKFKQAAQLSKKNSNSKLSGNRTINDPSNYELSNSYILS